MAQSFWERVRSGLVAGLKAFKEAYVVGDFLDPEAFVDFDARRLRYAILWSFYENSAYRHIHAWSTLYKARYGLYRYVRNVYNPCYRLGEFWKAHLWGGRLDPEAGPGDPVSSALPLVAGGDIGALRGAVATLWRWSNWQVRKDLVTLYGAVMGDVGVRVVDDTEREKVYLEVVHPSTLAEVTLDPFGNVKAYTIKETRDHPLKTGREATYTETAERGAGEAVVYRTYLDGSPYAWNGQAAEWIEPYGFIPLVVVKHNDVGLDWGWSEFHPALAKIRELDDLASMLSDQLRKTINAKWFFAGAKAPSAGKVALARSLDSTTRPEAGREEEDALYSSDPSAKPHALVAPIDVEGAVLHITKILEDLERDYPELRFDNLRAKGEVSGRALRVARQPAETKAVQRRAVYDDALVRAQQMAVAIGGFRGYEGFGGFDLDSYDRGDLNHSIGERPVFAIDPMEELDEDKLFWETAEVATKVIPAEVHLKRQGWTEKELAELEASPDVQARRAMQELAARGMAEMEADGG